MAIARVLEADAATRREDLATKSDMKIALAELKIERKDDLQKTMATFSFRVYLAILAQLAVTISFTYYLLQGIKG